MPRRRVPPKRRPPPDPVFGSTVLSVFVARLMERGKKSKAYQIVYDALGEAAKKVGKEPVEVLTKALDNVKPVVEVKSRRVGGATYQVPVEVREERREALGMRWLIQYARARSGADMQKRLSAEFVDAFNNTGNAVKKKEDTHKMAEANKAFAHYRW